MVSSIPIKYESILIWRTDGALIGITTTWE